jgi:hypothetical protein
MGVPSIASRASTWTVVAGSTSMTVTRSIGRSCRKDSGEGDPFVVPRMGLQDAAVGLVQPGHHDQLGAGGDPMKRRRELRFDFERGRRCALEGLTWRVVKIAKRGSHQSNRLDHDGGQHRAKCR